MRTFKMLTATMVAAGIVAGTGAAAWALPAPSIQQPCFEVKWILRPDGSDRAWAESMGYETVEHGDLSYPGSRLGC